MDNIQKIRLVDVFVISPLLLYAGGVKSNLHPIVRGGLVVTGIATFLYNGTNFIKNQKL